MTVRGCVRDGVGGAPEYRATTYGKAWSYAPPCPGRRARARRSPEAGTPGLITGEERANFRRSPAPVRTDQ